MDSESNESEKRPDGFSAGNPARQFEERVVQVLEQGDIQALPLQDAVLSMLEPRYEFRVQAVQDPIAVETKLIRSIVEEVDDRYSEYSL